MGMGSTGLSLDIRRIGEGDVAELWYELKEAIVHSVWMEAHRLNGFKAYFNDESFHVWMADHRDGGEASMYFAFWEDDVDPAIVAYAIHLARISIEQYPASFQPIANKHGFELVLDPPAPSTAGRFAKHGSSICRLKPWRRGQPIDETPAFVACAHRGAAPKTAIDLRTYRASAMLGVCACPCCRRQNESLLGTNIAQGWAALDRDPTGVALLDEPSVLGDWFAQAGVVLKPDQISALVAAYRIAPARDADAS